MSALTAEARDLIQPRDHYTARRPRCAVNALPGTPEKVAVMMARVASGEAPCHPDDAQPDDDSPLGRRDRAHHANGSGSWGEDKSRAASTVGHEAADEREVRAEIETRRLAAIEAAAQKGRRKRR